MFDEKLTFADTLRLALNDCACRQLTAELRWPSVSRSCLSARLPSTWRSIHLYADCAL